MLLHELQEGYTTDGSTSEPDLTAPAVTWKIEIYSDHIVWNDRTNSASTSKRCKATGPFAHRFQSPDEIQAHMAGESIIGSENAQLHTVRDLEAKIQEFFQEHNQKPLTPAVKAQVEKFIYGARRISAKYPELHFIAGIDELTEGAEFDLYLLDLWVCGW